MPTTAQNDGRPEDVGPRGVDPLGEVASERQNDVALQVEVPPPDSNPPLPFVTWPVPPQGLEEIQ